MEEKKEYLNEEEYQKNNVKVKKAGKIVIIVGLSMLVVGIILIIIGVLGIGTEATNSLESEVKPIGILLGFGGFAVGGTLTTTGIFVTVVGLMIRFLIGNKREITAYTTQQVMPVAKEGIEKMAPTAGKVAKEVAKGIKEGINEADKK